MKRPTLKFLVALAVTLAFLIYCLASEPSKWVQTNSSSWIVVRLIAGAIGFVLAFLSFTSGKLVKGVNQLKIETKYLKDKNNEDLEAMGYSGFDIWLIEAPFKAWIIWFVICFEVMVTFYVSDWCPTGI
jgi:hypothetical protein